MGQGSGGCSCFCYLDDNHTSVVGMREVAQTTGARTLCLSADAIRTRTSEPHPPPPATFSEPHPPSGSCSPSSSEPHPPPRSCSPPSSEPHPPSGSCSPPSSEPHPPPASPHPAGHGGACSSPEPHPPTASGPYHLFAYPAQSNFSGFKYPLSWCDAVPSEVLAASSCEAASGTWLVVLDAASLVSSSPLDLTSCRPHFLALSFYKLFGFPTGLGALLVRRDCAHVLSKHYYGGGTVKATDSWTSFHVPKDQLHDRQVRGKWVWLLRLIEAANFFLPLYRMEDGTLPFLDILALRHGFATLSRLARSMTAIQHHTFDLARLR